MFSLIKITQASSEVKLQIVRTQVLPAVVDLAGSVVLTVVVSSVVVPRGEVAIFVVVTFTLVGTVCGSSLAGAPVDISKMQKEKYNTTPKSISIFCLALSYGTQY